MNSGGCCTIMCTTDPFGNFSFTCNLITEKYFESGGERDWLDSVQVLRTHDSSPPIFARGLSFLLESHFFEVAEREGFEPPVPFGTTVFKTAAFDHSAISP